MTRHAVMRSTMRPRDHRWPAKSSALCSAENADSRRRAIGRSVTRPIGRFALYRSTCKWWWGRETFAGRRNPRCAWRRGCHVQKMSSQMPSRRRTIVRSVTLTIGELTGMGVLQKGQSRRRSISETRSTCQIGISTRMSRAENVDPVSISTVCHR